MFPWFWGQNKGKNRVLVLKSHGPNLLVAILHYFICRNINFETRGSAEKSQIDVVCVEYKVCVIELEHREEGISYYYLEAKRAPLQLDIYSQPRPAFFPSWQHTKHGTRRTAFKSRLFFAYSSPLFFPTIFVYSKLTREWTWEHFLQELSS